MPKGVTWIRQAVVGVDPDAKVVALDDGSQVGDEFLVMCPGIQLDWEKITGLRQTLGRDRVSGNYPYELAPATWKFIRETRSGSAVFTMPSGPIKCAGAPQKIAYLAADYWREQGVLNKIDIYLVLPTPGMFGVKEFSDVLAGVARRFGITVHLQSEAIGVNPDAREVTIADRVNDTESTLGYDVKHTMQHTRYPDVFALGDAGSSPNSKTGAAIRKQAPVVVANLVDVMAGKPPTVGIPAAYLGTLNRSVDQRVLLLAFAAITLVAAITMLINNRSAAPSPRPGSRFRPHPATAPPPRQPHAPPRR